MLTLRNIRIAFIRYDTGLIRKEMDVINGLDLQVRKGELVAVVGASGSGKSVLAHAVLGILPGNIRFSGEMIFKGAPLTPERQRAARGREIALIPQSVVSLDPVQRIGVQVRRAAVLSGVRKKTAIERQKAAFERYDLPESVERMFPFQLSGGMARRVLMATATVGDADMLIADEPTPGLHPEVVHESLSYLRELADRGKSVLLITHELEAVLRVADRIAVFYAGTVVEVALSVEFNNGGGSLRHPFTRALWNALPTNAFVPAPAATAVPAMNEDTGCPFAGRCPDGSSLCDTQAPAYRDLRGGFVRCHHA
jgi:peptide/nickel transport system ATP-binding protein